MRSEGSTGSQRGPHDAPTWGRTTESHAVLEIAWSDDGELIGVTLAGDPLTPGQARALRTTIVATVGADNALPHLAIDAWEARLWREETGANRGEPA